MEDTTYRDEDVVNLVNSHFIAISVDNDRRPDINQRYNMGGWPTTVFLTPTGEILTGGTYFPPQKLKLLLERVSNYYREHRDEIYAKISESEHLIEEEIKLREGKLNQKIIHDVIGYIVDSFDPDFGGFGNAPKFHHSDALNLSLKWYNRTGDEYYLNIVLKTLDKMSSGVIFDHVYGGFFRYSTTRDWSIPHFEKMLEDNANLLKTYLNAYAITSDLKYKETAIKILNYIDSRLFDKENGGFYGSQSADEEFYRLDEKERAFMKEPPVDKTKFTNWNSIAISSYLHAFNILDEKKYLKYALKSIEFLLKNSYEEGEGVYHYSNELKILSDQIYFSKALIDAYESTGKRNFIEYSKDIADFILKNFYDNSGGFFDIMEDKGAIGNLKMRNKGIQENVIAAQVFIKLHYLLSKKDYIEIAEKTLLAFSELYQRYGIFACAYADAVDMYLYPVNLVIVGPERDEGTINLHKEVLRFFEPNKIIEILNPEKHEKRISKLNYPVHEEPKLYVCANKFCSEPIDADERAFETMSNFVKSRLSFN